MSSRVVFKDGEYFDVGPKGQEPISIIVVNGRISIELVKLGVSRDDAGRIIANLKPEEKVKALSDKDFRKLIVTRG